MKLSIIFLAILSGLAAGTVEPRDEPMYNFVFADYSKGEMCILSGKEEVKRAIKNLAEIKMGFMTGLNRLPNGNTVICFYQGSHHVIEVTTEKKLVWKWRLPSKRTVVSAQIPVQEGDALKGQIYK